MTLRSFATLALFLQFGLGAVQPQQKASVEGSVSNSSTGQPVAGARVTLTQQGESRTEVASALADQNGRFSVQVAEGSYTVRFQANGFVPRVYGQRAADDPPFGINLGAGQTARNVNVSLTPAANVSGRVRDELDRPLVNVPVQLLHYSYNEEGERTYQPMGAVQTDDRGEYRLYWVTPGRYYLFAGKAPSNPILEMMSVVLGGMNASGSRVPPVKGHAFYPGVTDIVNARSLDLQPGADLQAVDITVVAEPQTYTLKGKLIDSATGQPPAQARVLAITQTPGLSITNMQAAMGMPNRNYDAQSGKIEIPDLLPGVYSVIAITEDPLAATRVGPPVRSTGALAVSISNADVEDLIVSVAPAVSITGRLRLQGKVPAAASMDQLRPRLLPTGPNSSLLNALRIQLYSSPSFFDAAQVKADGTFRVDNMVPGEYRLEGFEGMMGLLGGYGFIKEARFEGQDILTSPMRFSGSVAGGLDIVIAAGGGKLSGTVTDARSQPVSGQQVVIVPERARFRRDLYRTT